MSYIIFIRACTPASSKHLTLKCWAHFFGAVSETSMSGASGSNPATPFGPSSMCQPEGASTDTMGGGLLEGDRACSQKRREDKTRVSVERSWNVPGSAAC